MIQLLRTELDAYRLSGSRQNLSVLRQGLFVLRALAAAANVGKSRTFESHYASVHDDFLLLMSGVVRLFWQRDLCIPEHESMHLLYISSVDLIKFTVVTCVGIYDTAKPQTSADWVFKRLTLR